MMISEMAGLLELAYPEGMHTAPEPVAKVYDALIGRERGLLIDYEGGVRNVQPVPPKRLECELCGDDIRPVCRACSDDAAEYSMAPSVTVREIRDELMTVGEQLSLVTHHLNHYRRSDADDALGRAKNALGSLIYRTSKFVRATSTFGINP